MRVCIWWKTTSGPWGGGNAFFNALIAEFTQRGVEVVQRPSPDCDAIIVNAWNLGPNRYNSTGKTAEVRGWARSTPLGRVLPASFWRRVNRSSVPLIHRVDGVAKLGRGTAGDADPIQFSINPLCDFTVFQSEYSRQVFSQFGVTPRHWSVVHNGVDGETFFPDPDHQVGDGVIRIAASSWSPNKNKGFAQLAELSALPGVELHFIGRWSPEIPARDAIDYGPRKPAEVATILRGMDAFVHASKNEACSNSILEALATGLPVIYIDSGANRELAGEFGVELKSDVGEAVDELRSSYSDLRQKVLDERDRFLISRAADGYVEAIESAADVRHAAEGA